MHSSDPDDSDRCATFFFVYGVGILLKSQVDVFYYKLHNIFIKKGEEWATSGCLQPYVLQLGLAFIWKSCK